MSVNIQFNILKHVRVCAGNTTIALWQPETNYPNDFIRVLGWCNWISKVSEDLSNKFPTF